MLRASAALLLLGGAAALQMDGQVKLEASDGGSRAGGKRVRSSGGEAGSSSGDPVVKNEGEEPAAKAKRQREGAGHNRVIAASGMIVDGSRTVEEYRSIRCLRKVC